MRNLMLYKWKSGFHKLVWDKIKFHYSNKIPNWTYEELERKGYHLRIGGVNSSATHIVLTDNRGNEVAFRVTIGNVVMPVVAGVWAVLSDVKTTGNDENTLQEIYDTAISWYGAIPIPERLTNNVLQNDLENGNKLGIGWRTSGSLKYPSYLVGRASRERLAESIQSIPLDNSITYPGISTMEEYFKVILTASSSNFVYWPFR